MNQSAGFVVYQTFVFHHGTTRCSLEQTGFFLICVNECHTLIGFQNRYLKICLQYIQNRARTQNFSSQTRIDIDWSIRIIQTQRGVVFIINEKNFINWCLFRRDVYLLKSLQKNRAASEYSDLFLRDQNYRYRCEWIF